MLRSSSENSPAPHVPSPLPARRRRWSKSQIDGLLTALAKEKTAHIASKLQVSVKALRSLMRRNGVNLRELRKEQAGAGKTEGLGVLLRRSAEAPLAIYGADALAELAEDACRWPIGDPAEPDFAYCGRPQMVGSSYCARHLRRAYEPRAEGEPAR